MSTRLDICNNALREVGHVTITHLGEDSTTGELCRELIGLAVREVLDSGLWKCARAGAELGQVTLLDDEKGFGWSYAYQLPEDYIRLVSFNELDESERWQELFEVRGDRLLTGLSRVRVVYVRDLSAKGENVHLMPPLLERACVLNLAAKLAWPLQQSTAHKQFLEQAAEVALRKAKSRGAVEEFKPRLNPFAGSRWLAARG